MATRTLINDVNNDWNNTANWSGATVPATGDTIVIPSGDYTITANVDQSAVSNVSIYVEEQFAGQIGTAASPLKFGSTAGTSDLTYRAPRCKGFYLDASLSAAYVLDTYPVVGALHLVGGTVDALEVYGGAGVLLGAAGTFTTVVLAGEKARVEAEAGNTITTLRVLAGLARVATQITTAYVHEGTLELLGESKTYSTVEIHGQRGVVLLECPDSTITQGRVYAGRLDGRFGARPVTVTNCELWAGGHVWYGRHIVETNALINHGGDYRGYGTAQNVVPSQRTEQAA